MTCSSCRHCAMTPWPSLVLWCSVYRTVPVRRCPRYEREPGSDDA